MKRKVVGPLAALGQKPPNRRVFLYRLDQLQPALAQHEHRRLHLLMLHRLLGAHTHPERLVEDARQSDAAHGYAYMVEPQRQILHYGTARLGPRAAQPGRSFHLRNFVHESDHIASTLLHFETANNRVGKPTLYTG